MKPEVQSALFLSARDLAPLLGVTPRRVHQLIRAGRLPALREGRSVWVPRAAWEQWLQRRAEAALAAVQDEHR